MMRYAVNQFMVFSFHRGKSKGSPKAPRLSLHLIVLSDDEMLGDDAEFDAGRGQGFDDAHGSSPLRLDTPTTIGEGIEAYTS